MTYAEWVNAVDTVLRNSGSGLRTGDLDLQEMQASFQRGESPVVYAKRAKPRPPVASAKTTKPISSYFDPRTCGWILVALGVLICIWYQLIFDTTTGTRFNENNRIHNIGLLNDRLVGFMTGATLALGGLLLALLSPYGYSRECDYCKEPISPNAKRCRWCSADLP